MADQYWYPGGLTDADFASGPSGTGHQPHNFCYGAKVNIGVAGTVTSLGLRCTSASGTPTVKIAIFNSAGTLLGNGTFTNDTSAAWRDATGLSIAVSSGDHYIMISSSDTNTQMFYNTGGNGLGESVAYASFPPNPLASLTEDETGTRFGVRAFVVESAAGQFSRPDADITDGAWTAQTGADLFAMVDETAASDADWIQTHSASTCEIRLSDVTDPVSSSGHIVRYRAIGNGTADLVVALKQGAATVATWTETNAAATLTDYSHTLSGAEADSITDYTDLRLTFQAVA